MLLLPFFLLIWAIAYGQENLVVKGTVTDADKNPLVGASIQNKNKGVTVISDTDGKFVIHFTPGDVLYVDFFGMLQQKITVNSEKELTIVMDEDKFTINEVVVTGYQKIDTRHFVGATAKVLAKDLALGGSPDLSSMLEGRLPGLNISTPSGTFGAAPKINIRGGASLNSNVTPLWVIDGAVYEDIVPISPEQLYSGDAVTMLGSAISSINATDIESVEILKDASATSLYGARGMNGVIVVTTKSGKRGTGLSVNYRFETGFRIRPSNSDYDLLNSQESMAIYREMENKGYFSMEQSLYGRRGGIYHQMYKAINTYENGKFKLENTEEAKAAFLRKAEYRNTDWFKEIYKNSLTRNHSVSIVYGGDKSSTYASFGLYLDPGETVADKVRRYTATIKNTYRFNDKFKADFSIMAGRREQFAPGTFARIQNLDLGEFRRDFDINPFNYAISSSGTLAPRDDNGNLAYYRNDWAKFNILNEYDNNKTILDLSDIQTKASFDWNIFKNFNLGFLISSRIAVVNMQHRIGDNSNVILAHKADGSLYEKLENIYLLRNPNDISDYGKVVIPQGGIYNKNTKLMKSLLGRLSADYSYTKENHRIKFFSYLEIKKRDMTEDNFKGYGISYDRAYIPATSPLVFEKLISLGQDYFSLHETFERGISASANLTYDYKYKYILSLTGNYEGANISGKGTRGRWLPTWNIGGKWNVSEEPFFSVFKPVVSSFAIRTGFGLVAKMNPLAVNSLAVYNGRLTFRQNLADREYAIRIKHLENRDLTWEKMYEYNLGADAGFFDGRVYVTADFYLRNSFDLIDMVRTSGIGGEFMKWANFADMRTIGADLMLRADLVRTKNFTWNTFFTFAGFNQKITKMRQSPNTFDLVSGNGRGALENYPRSGLYSFHFEGLDERGLPTFYFGNMPSDLNAFAKNAGADFYDMKYNKSYLVYSGSLDPYITGGIGNTLKYKNWQFSAFISYQLGSKVRLQPTFDPSFGDINVFSKKYYNRWLHKGDEKVTNVPVIPGNDLYNLLGKQNIERTYNTYNYSDVNVADGSFVRLKNVSITYTLPESVCDFLRIKGLSLTAQAVNPCLLYSDSKLNGKDPEFVNSGGVASPISKIYSLTMNAKF